MTENEGLAFMHNLLRVCDRQLPPAQRVDSLRLIDRLSRRTSGH